MVPLGVTKARAQAAEMKITLDPKFLEEDGEVSPLRTRQSMTSPMTTGIYTREINTPYIVIRSPTELYFPSG